jgi:hypothetical protein
LAGKSPWELRLKKRRPALAGESSGGGRSDDEVDDTLPEASGWAGVADADTDAGCGSGVCSCPGPIGGA